MVIIKKYLQRNLPILIIIAMACLAWSWLFLIDVVRLSSSTVVGYGIIAFVFFIIVSITSLLAFGAWRFITGKLKQPSWKSLLQIVLIWSVTEMMIAWVVSAIWMGHGGSWDNILPFYSLTPAIMHTPLRFLARFFGFYGTSAVVGTFLLVLLAGGKPWRKYAIKFGVLLVVLNLASFGLYRVANGSKMNAIITSEKLGFPQKIKTADSQLVILPEYGLDDYDSNNVTDRFTSSKKEVYFSGTRQFADQGRIKNTLIYGSNKRGYIEEHDKSRLIVGGEYLSLPVELVLKRFQPSVYYMFDVQRLVERGNDKLIPFALPNNEKLGNAACSSIINPEDYRKLTMDGSSLLANSASLEIFRGSRIFGFYHDGLASFMATANARPFLQSSNNWKAFALDHNGNIVKSVGSLGSSSVEIETNYKKTPFTALGEWVAIAGVVYIVAIMVKRTIDKRMKRSARY